MSFEEFKLKISSMAAKSNCEVLFEHNVDTGVFKAMCSDGTIFVGRENEFRLSVKFGKH